MGASVTTLCADSRMVSPGDVFLAYPGGQADGRRFIAEAIAAGAGAVLWEKKGFSWQRDWQVPNLAVADLKHMAGPLADEVYGRPSAQVPVIAVTGTNGKTSCAQWIGEAYARLGQRAALIGTLGIGYPGALEASANTTPDPVLLHQALRRFVDEGAEAVVMEASSIGLEQDRLRGLRVQTAVFTNLSRDHLDYHSDMEDYARAKLQLFRQPGVRHAVLNMDDVLGVRIAQSLEGERVERVGYSMTPGAGLRSGLEHYLEAHHIRVSAQGLSFELVSSWGQAAIDASLLGRFNVANLLAVLGSLLVAGFTLEQAVGAVTTLKPASGRMQRLGGGDDQPLVVVDYAHTPDALEKVLGALRDVARAQQGQLYCVFGCGGDRDRGKRPLMGEAVSRYADHAIVTSDNPRSEEPAAIVAEILPGLSIPHDIDTDRKAAIRMAVARARPGDVVLIAGKGHEPYQEIAGRRLPFSDLDEARGALAERQS